MAKANIVFFKSKLYKEGHPVLLRVTHKSRMKHYTIQQGFVCQPEQWDEKKNEFRKSFGKNYNRSNIFISNFLSRAQKNILQLEDDGKGFSFEVFTKEMFNEDAKLYLIKYFDKIINHLIETDKISNAYIYKTTRNVLFDFLRNKDILMSDFEIKNVLSFEDYLRKRGNIDTTIHLRMRTLRAVYGKANKFEGLKNYPFKAYSFNSLKIETRKRALSGDNLKKIFNYKPVNELEKTALGCLKFMVYAQGINFGDLCRLRKTDVQEGKIFYARKKSKQLITFTIHEQLKEIIEQFSDDVRTSIYLFPVLHQDIHKTEKQKVERIKKGLRRYNKGIKQIAKNVGIESSEEITTNVFRHSWATLAKNIGITASVIGEGMGHKDEKTTQIYLASFDHEIINEANKKVSDFINNKN